jgi:hypothetical protein
MRSIGQFRWLQCWAQLNTNRIVCLICQLINSPLIAPTDSWQINRGTNFSPLNTFLISVLTSHASRCHCSASLYPRTKPDALPSSHLILATYQHHSYQHLRCLPSHRPRAQRLPGGAAAEGLWAWGRTGKRCPEGMRWRWMNRAGGLRSPSRSYLHPPSEARKMEEDM